MKRVVLILLFSVIVNSCREEMTAASLTRPVYEVYVMGFADGDGDGKGDLNGLTSKLDYLENTGFGTIWLSPVMPSPSFHKYDILDYKAIDPDYGSLDDFRKLTKEAHERSMRVIIDLLMNCTSIDHPWFKEASSSEQSEHRNYYLWLSADSIQSRLEDQRKGWYVNKQQPGEYYYSQFGERMPQLNFDNPKVKAEFAEIGKFWIGEMGADGFRLGAAEKIFPAERVKDNIEFWAWFKTEMQKVRQDVYMIGEVWTEDPQVIAPYLRGLSGATDFSLYRKILSVIKDGSDSAGFVAHWRKVNDAYASVTGDFYDAPFIDNHDFNRILTELNDDPRRARLAASILLSLPGTPYIYYGQEIGMKGRKPDIREGFIWAADKNDPAQTSWKKPVYSTPETVVPLAQQKKDSESFYTFYKNWIAFRNDHAIIPMGSLHSSSVSNNSVLSWVCKGAEGDCLVLHNLSDVEVTIPPGAFDQFGDPEFNTNDDSGIFDGELKLAPLSTIILKSK